MNSRTDIKNNEIKIDKIFGFSFIRYFNVFLILLASASLSAQETNCVDGVDNDNDGKIDYLDSDCDCIIGVSNIIKFDFSNFTPIIGTGTSINNQIRYNNVGQIGNISIDVIATVTSFTNISALDEHGLTGTDDAFVVLPNENNSSGDVYSTTVRYQLFQSGTTSPIAGSFEIEIADIDFWSSSGSEREEAIAVRQNEITNYYLSNPTNLTTNFSNSKVTITGTQIQTDADANGAVKFLFVNQDEFTIDFSSKQTSSLTTGRAGFAVDGNEFTIFNTCLPPEDCLNGIDDDGDGLVDCDDPDCYLVSKTGGNDNDNDGIDDICDLDDDNDGITDLDEGCNDSPSSFPNAEKGYLFQGSPTKVYTVDIQTGTSTLITTLTKSYNALAINETNSSIWAINHSNGNKLTVLSPNTFNEIAVFDAYNSVAGAYDPIRKVYVTLNRSGWTIDVIDANATSSTYGNLLYKFPYSSSLQCSDLAYNSSNGLIYGVKNSSNVLIQVDIINQTVTNLGSVSGLPSGIYGAGYSLFDGKMFFADNGNGNIYSIIVSSGISASLFTNGPPSSSNDGAKVLGVDLNGHPICLDTDNDGIINSQDLDSDGDGCPDVVEAGGVDNNGDGILDGTGTSIDGKITGGTGGYNGTAGNEITANRMSIINAPNNQTKNTGESTTLSVVVEADIATSYSNGTPLYTITGNANNSINYQWYLGNPNTTGTPISNTGIYSGANTATLNISDVTDLNGSMYCVKVTHENNPCLEEIQCAILSVNTMEICGDGQDNDGDGLIDCADSDCSPVIADVIPTNLACGSNNNNGKVVITATGVGTITYSITNEAAYQSSNIFSNLGQGLYTIRVKNGIGCVATYNAAIIRLETPTCIEVCNDGIDNDGNGLIDCDDPECTLNEIINNINQN